MLSDAELFASHSHCLIVSTLKGSYIYEQPKWKENAKITSPCNSTLVTLRKTNSLQLAMRKNLVQAFVLSKVFYNDAVYNSLYQNRSENAKKGFQKQWLLCTRQTH